MDAGTNVKEALSMIVEQKALETKKKLANQAASVSPEGYCRLIYSKQNLYPIQWILHKYFDERKSSESYKKKFSKGSSLDKEDLKEGT